MTVIIKDGTFLGLSKVQGWMGVQKAYVAVLAYELKA